MFTTFVSPLEDPSRRNLRLNIDKDEPIVSRYAFIRRILRTCNYFVISTDESFLFYWLILLNIFVLYNLWFSIARQAFDPLQRDYAKIWEIMDYVADAMYLLDVAIQFRTGYLEQGITLADLSTDDVCRFSRSTGVQSYEAGDELRSIISFSSRHLLVDATRAASTQIWYYPHSSLSPLLQSLPNVSTLLPARVTHRVSQYLSRGQSVPHPSASGPLARLVLLHGVESRGLRRLLVLSEARGQLFTIGKNVSPVSLLVNTHLDNHRRSPTARDELAVSRLV